MINTSSTHTILFKTPSGLLASQKLKIAFPYAGGGFSFGSATGTFNVVNDIDVASSTAVGGTYTDYTLSTGTAAAVGSIAVATTTASGLLWFTFYAPSNMSIPSSTWLRIRIGTNAGSGGVGAVSMINPSPATSSLVTITTTDASDNIIDRGYLSLAIITNDQVAITATVLPTLTFDWNATSTGTVGSENCAAANSMASSSNKNAIDFGALTPAVAKIGCHFLFVGTNASQGYSVTAQQNHDLWQNGSTTMTISPFKNGVPQTAPAAWASPSGTYGSHLTYGHFGFTSSDTALSSSTPNVFNTGASFAGFSSTSSME
ncbi:MAG: hypothetical protein NTV81_04510, partial [Candidatus Komeilibacteria bacterium]|nr:hypothetical protein [Candidatus Komeilibacteria bacterium]